MMIPRLFLATGMKGQGVCTVHCTLYSLWRVVLCTKLPKCTVIVLSCCSQCQCWSENAASSDHCEWSDPPRPLWLSSVWIV